MLQPGSCICLHALKYEIRFQSKSKSKSKVEGVERKGGEEEGSEEEKEKIMTFSTSPPRWAGAFAAETVDYI